MKRALTGGRGGPATKCTHEWAIRNGFAHCVCGMVAAAVVVSAEGVAAARSALFGNEKLTPACSASDSAVTP